MKKMTQKDILEHYKTKKLTLTQMRKKGYIDNKYNKMSSRTYENIFRVIHVIPLLVRDNYTMVQIANFLGMSESSFYLWRKKEEALEEALEEGWALVDESIEVGLDKLISGEYEHNGQYKHKPDLGAIKYKADRVEKKRMRDLNRSTELITQEDLSKLSDKDLIDLLKELEEEGYDE